MVSPPDARLPRSARPKSARRQFFVQSPPASHQQQAPVNALLSTDGSFGSLTARSSCSSSSSPWPPRWPARPACLERDDMSSSTELPAFGTNNEDQRSAMRCLETSEAARRPPPTSPSTPHFGTVDDSFAEVLSRRLEKAQFCDSSLDVGADTDTTASGSPGCHSHSFSSVDSPTSSTVSLSPRRQADFSRHSRPSSACQKWSDMRGACSTAVPSTSCSRPSSAHSWGSASRSAVTPSSRAASKIRERVAESRLNSRGPWPGAGEGPVCGGLPLEVSSSTCWGLVFETAPTSVEEARRNYGGTEYEKKVAYEEVRERARRVFTSKYGSAEACELSGSLDDAKECRHIGSPVLRARGGRTFHFSESSQSMGWCCAPPMIDAQSRVAPRRHGQHVGHVASLN